MIKWARKVLWWRRDSTEDPVVYDYGRYVHKPVLERAITMVTSFDYGGLHCLVDSGKIYLNNDKLQLSNLKDRLPSGQYEIKFPEQNKVWRFFIG